MSAGLAQDLVVLAALAAWGLVDLRRGSPNRVLRESGTAESDNTGTLVGLILPLGVVGALLASTYHGDRIWAAGWWPVSVGVGVGVMVAGMALRRWSIRCLGQWFSIDIRIQDYREVTGSFT